MSIIGDPLLLGGGSGGNEGIVITDTPDAAGGTVRTITAVEISGTKSITENGVEDVAEYASVNVQVPSSGGTYQAKTNVTPSTSSQTITPDEGYDALSSVQINAMPSGTAGTPTATKSAVYNNTITVTPSVTNTAGYISGGTKNGTAVTVTASEVDTGTLYCDEAGTWNVVGAANFVVDAGTVNNPTAAKSAVSNHSVTVTPSVTASEGWIKNTTKTGTAVTVSASELVSGKKEITANGDDIDVTEYEKVKVNVSGGSVNIGTVTSTNSSNQNTTISFTLPSGRTPKAFFVRLTSQIARNSSSRYYYVFDMRWDGSSNGGVAGNTFYMYNGTLTNVTSGYSYSQDGTTFTLSSTGSRSASPGSFFNGTYEMVYVY